MNGPFGNYEGRVIGTVLNAIVEQEKVPMYIADSLTVDNKHLNYRGKLFGQYNWLGKSDTPIFYWQDQIYNQQRVIVNEDGTMKPDFRVTLSTKGTPGLVIHGDLATPELHEFMNYPMLTNVMFDECYKLKINAGAFFQGGSHDPNGKFIFIEFWLAEGAQAFVDYVNNNFTYPKPETT